ncbi:unnamed protein product [Clavelina lepadiformis]|uniref:Rho-GAP domain-containing protein n=1 Tax=Clavelina lepadiformis TaxID=159417 RepID=A0ABP0GZK7_CLALP
MSQRSKGLGEDKKDLPVVLQINRIKSAGAEQVLNSSKPPSQHTPSIVLLTKSSSKSEDSLDSGVYTRQKSCESMDSLDSNESGFNGEGSTANFPGGLSPSDEVIPPLPTQQYEDYLREVQDIRQSIIVKNQEEEKQPVSRTDSGDDQEDDDREADWLRLAGLSDLVMTSASTMMTSPSGRSVPSHVTNESLSSMTVLSTLTRPQREAVLRRITSFNRAQKSKRRPKPAITAVFPDAAVDVKPPTDNSTKPKKPDELALKSTSLPRDGGYTDGGYPRRYSETPQTTHKDTAPSSPVTPGSPGNNQVKLDYLSKHKRNVASIVATNPTEGVETLSISAHSVDRSSWKESKDEISMQFTDVANRPQDKTMSYTETANQESLPNFSLVKDRLGITKISDLSPIDMRKVQSLALIELTALFDLRGIDLKRRKLGKMKPKDSGVFGIPLTTLVECDRKRTNNPNICVPLVLSQIISFLETNALRDEGILRKSGSAARTKMLRQEIEVQFGINNLHQDAANQSGSASWPDAYPNDVAAILKEFLRGLPDPLLTTEYIEAFQSCGLITDRKEQLQALNLLIILLNQVHRNSLKLLLKFLGQVVAAERMNKMSLNNVAMIIAPNLFLNKKSSKKESSNTSQDLKHAAGTSNIVRMLIKYHKLLWTVPAFMLTQVRHMNRAEISSKKHGNPSKDKYKGFFKAKAKDPGKKLTITQASQPFDYETPKGLIRVQAPNMKLTSMAVQLDIKLTASDVIAKFQRQCERMRETGSSVEAEEVTNATHALYEVGGNIHERCLDPDTNVSALIRVNPEVTWFIRPRIDR